MINPLKNRAVVITLVVIAVALMVAQFGKWPATSTSAHARPHHFAPAIEEGFQVRPRPSISLNAESFEVTRDPFAWQSGTNAPVPWTHD